MKRKTINKIAILMCGLITVPLFSLSSNALYTEISPDINVSISGKVEPTVKPIYLYAPSIDIQKDEFNNVTSTTDSYVQVKELKRDQSIASQFDKDSNANKYIKNFKFNNSYYTESELINNSSDFSINPTTDIYLSYTGYYVKGNDDKIHIPLVFNTFTSGSNVENRLLAEQKITGTEVSVYTKIPNLSTYTPVKDTRKTIMKTSSNDGIFEYKINLKSNFEFNDYQFKRIVYFKPTFEWNSKAIKINPYINEDIIDDYTLVNKTSSFYKYYIDSNCTHIQFLRMNTNNIYDQWNYSGKISLDNYSYNNPCLTQTIVDWNNWNLPDKATWEAKPI